MMTSTHGLNATICRCRRARVFFHRSDFVFASNRHFTLVAFNASRFGLRSSAKLCDEMPAVADDR
jgi:hypothetical protein